MMTRFCGYSGAGDGGQKYGALNANGTASHYYLLIDEKGRLIWKNTTGQLIPVEKSIADLAAVPKGS